MSKINDRLRKSGPINFSLDYIGPLQDFDKKSGGTYQARECKLRIPATSEIIDMRLFDNLVGSMKIGSVIRGEAGAGEYPNWSPVGSGHLTPENNIEQVKNERAFTKEVKEEVVNRIICTYIGHAISAGLSPREAKDIAIEAYDFQELAVSEILSRF